MKDLIYVWRYIEGTYIPDVRISFDVKAAMLVFANMQISLFGERVLFLYQDFLSVGKPIMTAATAVKMLNFGPQCVRDPWFEF